MNINKSPSPVAIFAAIENNQLGANQLEIGRQQLRSALIRSFGKTFTYSESLFPAGTKNILLTELAAIGCEVELRVNSRDGNYYEISPR